jgi:formate hydrogenlyase subunit 3/multisubunit Na+/H+ antiporter MnhD subunit
MDGAQNEREHFTTNKPNLTVSSSSIMSLMASFYCSGLPYCIGLWCKILCLSSLFNILQLKFLISSRLLLKKLCNGILDMYKWMQFYKNKWCGLPWSKNPLHTPRAKNASQPKASDGDRSPWMAGNFSRVGVWRVRAGVNSFNQSC